MKVIIHIVSMKTPRKKVEINVFSCFHYRIEFARLLETINWKRDF